MGNSTIMRAALAILVLLTGFLGYKYSTLSSENANQFEEIAELQKAQSELDNEYQEALSSLENMKNDNQELGALIESQKEELKSQKDKINNLIWTRRELNKAKGELTKLNDLTQQYLGQINQMKQKVEMLTNQNTELTETNQVLTASLESEKTISAELQETKTRLMSENNNLSSSNEELSKKVNTASAIKLEEVSFKAGSINDDGSFKKRIREKKMEAFQTCFTTTANIITDSGEELFYIKIVDESGQTINSNDENILINNMNGEEVRYSTYGKVEYNNPATEACVLWSPSSQIKKGKYTVDLYNKGFKVGSNLVKI